MRERVLLVLLVSTATGCGGGSPADAGAPDAASDAGSAPAQPAPPVLTPCPAGWREVADEGGLVTCDPWPETGYRDDCAYDEAHFPGTRGCARIGTACPADGWPEGLPTDVPIVYVDDDAAPGSDGTTRATAYASLVDAVRVAPVGTLIAVAVGRYDVAAGITLRSGTVLWGACVAETRITSSVRIDDGVAIVLLAEAGLRNLSLDAPAPGGVGVIGRDASLEGVVVSSARAGGVVVRGSTASLTARDVAIRDTEQLADGTYGRGVEVFAGGRLVLERAALERNHDFGLFASATGTSVEVRDTVIRGTMPQGDGTRGRGAEANTGASLVIERTVLERNHDTGLAAFDPDSSAVVRDAVIRDTMPRADGMIGRGVEVAMGAHVVLEHAVLERNRDAAFSAIGSGTRAELRDVLIRDTMTRADGTFGRGVNVDRGAHVVLERAVLERSHEVGLYVAAVDTSVEGSDAVVRDTSASADGLIGRGVDVNRGARLVLGRSVLERNHEVGLFASEVGTSVVLSDTVIRRTLPEEATGFLGAGLLAQRGATVDGSRVLIEQSSFSGATSGWGASVALTDSTIFGVAQSGCATCIGLSGGLGVSAYRGGMLTMTGFAVHDAALCGVAVGPNDEGEAASGLDLSGGIVERAPIGACVLVDGYDTSRLRNGVEYRDVGAPLQSPMLLLPDLLPVL